MIGKIYATDKELNIVYYLGTDIYVMYIHIILTRIFYNIFTARPGPDGGYPSQVQIGLPRPGPDGEGVPQPGPDGLGTPEMGYPHPGMGYPQLQRWGTIHPGPKTVHFCAMYIITDRKDEDLCFFYLSKEMNVWCGSR